MLLTVAAVLVVVAVLAQQLPAGPPPGTRRVVLRKIYRTTVIETVRGSAGPSGTVVSQSVQSSGPSTAAAPATRTS